jgi:branched-chain amino acid transport system ATP-binding protein
MSHPLLATRDLSKTFGGLTAVDEVSLDFHAGRAHAIIGPNGAGKTTLINLLSGDIAPDQGRILYRGEDVTRHTAFEMSRLGLGRSYQSTNIFPDFTCWQNCWIGAQSRLPTSMRFLRPAAGYREVRERARRALAACGLENRRDLPPSRLSHGEQRQLEIGIMLATEPELLLLDEPLAGMGSEESTAVVALLQELAREHTLVLIEHDMDAVFALTDVLTVMVNGRVLATGTPEEIRRNEAVQIAYLGGDAASA